MMDAVQSQILLRNLKVTVMNTISAQVTLSVAKTTATLMWELLMSQMTAALKAEQVARRGVGENNKLFYCGMHTHMNVSHFSH